MEGLQKQGLEASNKILFRPRPEEHELITIDSTNSEPRRCTGYLLGDIFRTVQHAPPSDPASPATTVPAVPALCLIKLNIDHETEDDFNRAPTINTSRDDFKRLWNNFNLDKSTIYHISKGARGLHLYQSVPSGQMNDPSAPDMQFTVASYGYCMTWTYTPSTQTTRGAVIFRRNRDHHFKNWYSMLKLQTSSVRHPLCLFMVLAMETIEYAWVDSLKWQGVIYEIESLSQLNPWSSQAEGAKMTLDKATDGQQEVGRALVKIEDHIKQMHSLRAVVRLLEDAGFWVNLHGDSTTQMKDAGREIRQRVEHWQFRHQYLKERGQTQLNVLYNIINRYDAASSISIAQSARKDSRSMKTIADMTMWFLPGTCIATLFALPFVPAALASFWIYWTFAIPVTFLVVGIRYSWFSRALADMNKCFGHGEGHSSQDPEVGIPERPNDHSPVPEIHSDPTKCGTLGKRTVRVIAHEAEIV